MEGVGGREIKQRVGGRQGREGGNKSRRRREGGQVQVQGGLGAGSRVKESGPRTQARLQTQAGPMDLERQVNKRSTSPSP
ncbi:hypothetical protein EYF80_045723 [Liparis tanakae]|uniref:Uncharacterized protein n=1 Tax=Liparis tanakae TaxID=230148 RepID=A0A4Z2FS82_9TELE|nr:hypothetical protein EYF80_045723 [Liparis tanakae]